MRLLIAAGGHSRSILAAAPKDFFSGYLDIKINPDFPIPYLGEEDSFKGRTDVEFMVGVGYIGNGTPQESLRLKLLNKFAGCRFCTVKAADAFIAEDSAVGEGSVCLHRVVVNANCVIGRNCILNTGVIVEHDCVLGENVSLAPGVIVAGGCRIGTNTFIGMGTCIRQGISIGENIVVAMASVVTHDLEEPGLYGGFPLRRIQRWGA